jgi:hypothetical protein
MTDGVGGRTFAIRAAVVAFAALTFAACGSTSEGEGVITGEGTLVLQAFGGDSGEVAAQVPILEPGVGQERTCADPLIAGACNLTACQLGGIGSPARGYGNFGRITATVGATTVPITYDGYGYGTVYFPSPTTLGTAGIMTFRGGNGIQVPRFDVSATIPGLGVLTSPAPTTDGGAPIIDTSEDLSVTWSPITLGQVHFRLTGGEWTIGGVALAVACTFDGASGVGVVSKEILSALKEMSGANATYAGLSSELDVTTFVDGLTIVVQSFQTSPATAHDFSVTLQ